MDNQDNVWIDREEYKRLKTLEFQLQNKSAATTGNINGEVTSDSNTRSTATVSLLTIISGIFAIISFLFPPAILVFLSLGIVTLIKFFRGRSRSKTKIGIGVALFIGIMALLVVAGPFILFFAFFILWQIGCWTGLGSCTTA